MNDIFNQCIEIKWFQKGWWRFGKIPEIIDHLLHGGYLIDDRVRTFLQDGRVRLAEFILQFHLQSLGGKLDRRQWILDFMSQPAGNFTPCNGTLAGNHIGNIVENDDIAIFIIDGMIRTANRRLRK